MDANEQATLAKIAGEPEPARKRKADVRSFKSAIGKDLREASTADVRSYLARYTNLNTRRRILTSLRQFYTAMGWDITKGLSASDPDFVTASPHPEPDTIVIPTEMADRRRIAILLMVAAREIREKAVAMTVGELDTYAKRDPQIYAAFRSVYGAGAFMFPFDDRIDSDKPAFPDCDRLLTYLSDGAFRATGASSDITTDKTKNV